MSFRQFALSVYRSIYSISSHSYYRYQLPVELDRYYIFPRSPEHKGSFLYAVDISVPDPGTTHTIVYAPQSGIIRAGVLGNTKWGTSQDDKKYLNWINIEVDEQEFYEIAHVAPLPGRVLRAGDRVQKGEAILVTALNGRVTKTGNTPDYHLHILVGRWLNKNRDGFNSLKIRWESKPWAP